MSVSKGEVWDAVGYSPNHPVYGFSRLSENSKASLLQSYNSVEEEFQAFRRGDTEADTPEPDESEGTDTDEQQEASEHTEIQWQLIQLGLDHGYDVYVATNDQNRTYNGHRLGSLCGDSD